MSVDVAFGGLLNRAMEGVRWGESLTAERNRTLLNSKSTSNRLACMSRTSLAVVLRAPVMVLAALHWTGIRRLTMATELVRLLQLGEEQMGVNQMSVAYVKAGMATVL